MKQYLLFILFSGFFLMPDYSSGQSLAYRTLLKAYYDDDFPLVYPANQELLSRSVLLDTREREEYEVSHLLHARWVGYETFDVAALDSLPKDTPIVVYCSIGVRSQEIGKRLKHAGFREVYNLYGGIFHWVNEGLSVFNEQGPTRKVHAYSRSWGVWVDHAEKVY